MAQYDLTAKVAPYLDRHLVFPLLEFLQDKQLYADDQILKAKIELLAKTNMVDYAMDIHKSLYHTEDVPAGWLVGLLVCRSVFSQYHCLLLFSGGLFQWNCFVLYSDVFRRVRARKLSSNSCWRSSTLAGISLGRTPASLKRFRSPSLAPHPTS